MTRIHIMYSPCQLVQGPTMIKLLVTVCLALFSLASSAETRTVNKPVMCDSASTVFRTVIEDYEETVQWQGTTLQQGVSVALTVNLKTGAWTLIEYTATTACVISVGENAASRWGTPA